MITDEELKARNRNREWWPIIIALALLGAATLCIFAGWLAWWFV